MLKNKFVYLAAIGVIAGGTALAQSRAIDNPMATPILDSYTADLLACVCSIDHPDGRGVPERVRKSDEMRAKAWESANPVSGTAHPVAMAANERIDTRGHGPRSSGSPDGAK